MNLHASLAESLSRQENACPEDWEQTYRQMVLFDLAADMELGFFLAYYRNFAIPSIAETLGRNGEISQRPMKRSYDTGIVTYELITCGLDSERGRHMVDLLNRVHRHVPGSPDDFLYVLITLLVVPIRWARDHAWRPPTDTEEVAAVRLYQELGRRMHVNGVPDTFDEAARLFDDYEAKNIAGSPGGNRLMAGTVQVLRSRLPAPLRPLVRPLLSAMFDDVRLTEALGLPHPRRLTIATLEAGLSLRNATRRHRPLSAKPHFIPGKAGSSLYPNGYRLDGIGPVNVMTPATGAVHELP